MQYALKSDSLPRRANEFFDVDYNTSSVANAYLIDPGLAHYRGHHYTLDVALRNASATVYSSVNVLCHASFPVQTGFIPCFRASIYQYTAQTVEEVNQVCEAHAQVIFVLFYAEMFTPFESYKIYALTRRNFLLFF